MRQTEAHRLQRDALLTSPKMKTLLRLVANDRKYDGGQPWQSLVENIEQVNQFKHGKK